MRNHNRRAAPRHARKRSIHSASAQGSIALVGSSRIRIGAWRRNARANAMRCHSPVESSAPSRKAFPAGCRTRPASRSDDFIGPGGLGRVLDLRLGRPLVAQADVLAGRGIVTHRFLEQHRDVAPELLNLKTAQIAAIQLDAAAGRVVKAAEQFDEGALARPVGAYQAHNRAPPES